MSLNQTFNIYQKPQTDETIRKVENRTYYPYVKSFNNNDIITITINQSDSWFLMSDAAIVIEGKLRKTEGTGTVQLSRNGGAFLFDSIAYELNGQEVENVREPGIVSTIRGYLCYNKMDSNHLDIAGWNYPNYPIVTNENFVLRIPLKHLFGIFNDYQLAYFGRQTIRLIRARNDIDAILVVPNLNDATKGELTINNISLKVDTVVPNDVLKLQLLSSIQSDKPILIPSRKWDYHELPQLTVGATKEIWAVKTSIALESPRFIIVAFQSDRRNNDKGDVSRFDHLDIINIRAILNGEHIPTERMNLDFSSDNFVEAHFKYTQFYNSFRNDLNLSKQPLLDYSSFKKRTLFVIDCSQRNETLKASTVDVKIDIEAKTGFPANTKAYCIIIHDSIIEYLPLSEIVRSLT